MFNPDTELLFPPRVIPALRYLRGESWQRLVDCVLTDEETSLELLAFVLLMVRLSGCITCDSDAYRALHGCTLCAKQAVARYRGSDEDLSALYQVARTEVESYMQKKITNIAGMKIS
jgi:hypothetical protein